MTDGPQPVRSKFGTVGGPEDAQVELVKRGDVTNPHTEVPLWTPIPGGYNSLPHDEAYARVHELVESSSFKSPLDYTLPEVDDWDDEDYD